MKRFGFFFLLGLICLSAVNQTNAATTIVGGAPAAAGEYPHMVSIGYNYEPNGFDAHFCGGSLIAPNWVLTAAHCLVSSQDGDEVASDLAVIINRLNLNSSSGEKINVSQIIVHPNYNESTNNNDIALLKLASASTQGTIVVPVLTNETSFENQGQVAWATGYGDTTDGGTGSPTLLEVDLPLVTNTTCNNAYGSGITARMICAGYAAGGKDSCQNDSGGPLVTKDSAGNWRQVGVVSFGSGCAQPNAYGVYARVGQYENWLESHVGELTSPTITTPTFTTFLYLPFVSK